MKMGVLGTGMVGNTIGSKLIEVGHEVKMGSRFSSNEKATAWAESAGPRASHGSFREAAEFGEMLFNCTAGTGSLDALEQAGRENLYGKILIDISNPLDFSQGFPPSLTIVNTDSLGEAIQRKFPGLKVVKTLNTLNCYLMVNPNLIGPEHDIFISGNDTEAKKTVISYLGEWFWWKPENIIDLGDITTARGTEMMLPVWVRLFAALNSPMFNFHIVRG